MPYSDLPSGCTFPTEGDASGYDFKYNFQEVSLYYKRNTIKNSQDTYSVVCRISNFNQIFSFDDVLNRDNFYESLSGSSS